MTCAFFSDHDITRIYSIYYKFFFWNILILSSNSAILSKNCLRLCLRMFNLCFLFRRYHLFQIQFSCRELRIEKVFLRHFFNVRQEPHLIASFWKVFKEANWSKWDQYNYFSKSQVPGMFSLLFKYWHFDLEHIYLSWKNY